MCGWKVHRLFTTVIYIYFKIHQNFTELINPRQTYRRICEVMNSPPWKLHPVFQAARSGQKFSSSHVWESCSRWTKPCFEDRTEQLIGWLMFSPRKERIPAQMHHFITWWTEIFRKERSFCLIVQLPCVYQGMKPPETLRSRMKILEIPEY